MKKHKNTHARLYILLGIALCLLVVIFLFKNNKSHLKVANQQQDINNSALPITPANEVAGTLVKQNPLGINASLPNWTFQRYQTLMKESGRNPGISESIFSEIQKRKLEANQIVANYLKEKFGTADPEVLRAFNEVPREYFQYQYQNNKSFADVAYEDKIGSIKPWAIGWGSALSDYLGQTYMTQLIQPKSTDVALEIGTGSGFQSALLSRIVKKMYSIEIIKPLGEGVSKIYKPLGYDNIETRVGDGFYGWPEVQGGFDLIIVTAAAQYVPPALIAQLKPNGRMIVPVGQPFKRGQVLYVYTKDADGRVHSRKDVGVYFIPMTGAIQKQ